MLQTDCTNKMAGQETLGQIKAPIIDTFSKHILLHQMLLYLMSMFNTCAENIKTLLTSPWSGTERNCTLWPPPGQGTGRKCARRIAPGPGPKGDVMFQNECFASLPRLFTPRRSFDSMWFKIPALEAAATAFANLSWLGNPISTKTSFNNLVAAICAAISWDRFNTSVKSKGRSARLFSAHLH